MSVRLSDLKAPRWRHTFNASVYDMRPLCLQTFAELEGLGVSFATLSKGDLEIWITMYLYLAGLPDTDEDQRKMLKKSIQVDPLGFKVFQQAIHDAFVGSEDGEGPTVIKRRKIPDPRETEKRDGSVPEADMSFLITLARMAGIPLADLLQMTFRGIHAVQASLQDVPPTNPMTAMMGMAGGGGAIPRK